MNCLSINIQGAGSLEKRSWIRKLCHSYKVNFLAIQETKMEYIRLISVRSFWGNISCMHALSPSRGASCGILAIWDPGCINQK